MSSLSDNSPSGPRKRAKIAGPNGSTGKYTVGWICPLEVDLIAALEMLDEEHAPLEQQPSDHNVYTLGSIAGKNLVVAGLWQQGNNAAATVVTQMRMTFPNIRFGLLVGTGGGVPIDTDNGRLRLGDVVVSKPSGIHSGVVQYDRGKAYQGVFQRTGTLSPPPAVLLHAAQSLSAKRSRSRQDPIIESIRRVDLSIPGMRRFRYPGAMQDPRIVVHRGTIASGECVIKDRRLRDQLAAEHDILCFEMEAAGALADFPCLVIRGISNYCDTHKNDEWQGYAALAAAAYARELFFHLPVDQLKFVRTPMEKLEKHNEARERDKILNFISSFDDGDVQADTPNRSHEGTGQWLLNDPKFKDWIKEKQTLFCPGLPGAGKTVMTSIVNDFLHRHFQNQPDMGIGYVFCDFRQRSRQNLRILIGCLLRQLIRTTHQIPVAVQKLHARGIRPPTKDLLECFESVIGSFSRVYLVIDALDECEETTRNNLLSQLLKTQSLHKLHILATSRHVPEITSYFEGHPWLEIRANNGDVLSFLSGQMPTLPRFIRQDSSLREFVIQSIAQVTDDM
ncbi:nucleoside phosphorylase domain-containing protein [Aspergillus egyptiacus]|nr:nucleoside phosphorylase domain-containing protein [Aspergillus egyptiacus]